MADIARIGFSVDSSELRTANRRLDEFAAKEGRVKGAGRGISNVASRMGSTFRKTSDAVFSLQGALGALGATLLFREVLRANEAWTQQTNALRLVTDSTEELTEVQDELFDLAQSTRGALDGTIDLYSRLARSTEELGLEQDTLLSVTESVNKAVAISGSSAESASAALFQLGQGLAAGALRGEELNSVMEQTPRLARAIAQGLGVTIGELRTLGEQGELTAERVISALENQASVIDAEFDRTVRTVSQATTQISNELTRTLGQIDDQGLIDALDSLRGTLSDPAVISGVQSIASGMITIAENAIEAAASIGTFARQLGELAGEAVEGPERTAETITADLERINTEINRLTFDIERLNGTPSAEGLRGQREELEKQREVLRSIIGLYETPAPDATGGSAVGSQATNAPASAGGDGGGGGGSDLESRLSAALDLQENHSMQLQEIARERENNITLIEQSAMTDRLENAANMEMTLAERLEEIKADHEANMTAIQKREAEERAAIEQQQQSIIFDARMGVFRQSVQLLQTFAGESKEAAIAAIALDKALAIAQAKVNTAVAFTKALTIDPTGALSARVATLGAIQVGLIAATGLAQAAQVGQGGASAGTPANPVSTTTPSTATVPQQQQPQQQSQRVVEIRIEGNVYSNDDFKRTVADAVRESVDDEDVVIIGSNSRQARELQSS